MRRERLRGLVSGLLVLLLTLTLVQMSWAQGNRDKILDRVEAASAVLDEIMSAPDSGIPDEILKSAECVAIVPSLLKGGFVLGATYGKGMASCRTPNGWSAPAFFRVEGGSFGLQIGGQAVDLVMVIMNEKGMRNLLESKFKLGADASVAAGPVGRHAEGSTDWKMRAQVLTYSRARGVFAGITLNGASVRQDSDDTRDFYGRMVPYRTLLTGGTPAPEEAKPFLGALNKYAPIGAPVARPAAQKQPESQLPQTEAAPPPQPQEDQPKVAPDEQPEEAADPPTAQN